MRIHVIFPFTKLKDGNIKGSHNYVQLAKYNTVNHFFNWRDCQSGINRPPKQSICTFKATLMTVTDSGKL